MNPFALIDLHLHLDGSLSLDSVRQLAALDGLTLEDDKTLLKRLQVSPDCRDLNEYLEKFDFPCSLLQTPEALTLAVANLRRELAQQGLLYAEIRFAPQFHLARGMTQDQVVEAAVAIALADLKEELKKAEKNIFLVGDGANLCYNTLAAEVSNLILPPEHRIHQRATGVAILADRMAAAGQAPSGGALMPNYLRLSQAEREKLEKENKR